MSQNEQAEINWICWMMLKEILDCCGHQILWGASPFTATNPSFYAGKADAGIDDVWKLNHWKTMGSDWSRCDPHMNLAVMLMRDS